MRRRTHRPRRRSPGPAVRRFAGLIILAAGCGESPTPAGVEPGPTALAFTAQPDRTPLGAPLAPAPVVEVRDAAGDLAGSATTAVTLTLGADSGGAALTGTLTVNAVGGVATFDDVRVDRPGTGYTLTASAPGLTDGSTQPFDVPIRFTSVTAGSGHSCGMTVAGAYCWGHNASGQLGAPIEWRSVVPTRVTQAELDLTALAAGDFRTCALAAEGAAYCWGSNEYGGIGDNTTTDRPLPTRVAAPGGVTFSVIGSGDWHTCALDPDGGAWCWGANYDGQLGIGSRDASMMAHPLPEAVTTPDGVAFDSLAVGGFHACAVTRDGGVYCWGRNVAGQLGNGDERAGTGIALVQPSPAPIATPAGASFVAVTAGRHHTCALTTAGEAWCWGDNERGKLGDGTVDMTVTPVRVAVPAGVAFARIVAGDRMTCGLTAEGTAWCWGDNRGGGLGTNDGSYQQLIPTAVAAPEGVAFTQLAPGSTHVCALATDGRAWCWGDNDWGKLGDGTTEIRAAPVLVAGQ